MTAVHQPTRFCRVLFGQESQVVHLLADLRQQRQQHRGREPEQHEIEARHRRRRPSLPPNCVHAAISAGMFPRDDGDGHELQDQPDRLRDDLHLADEADAVERDGNDHQRADDVREPHRDVEHQVQRHRHDAGFDGEQQERERRVDQRGHRRAHVAEAGAAREQVDVHAVFRGVVGDGQADEEHQHGERADGPGGVRESVEQGERAADGFAGEEGNGAERGVADARRWTCARVCAVKRSA